MFTGQVWQDLAGCDFVLDLIGELEEGSCPSASFSDYPITPEKDESYYQWTSPDSSMLLNIPPAPDRQAPSFPPPSLPPEFNRVANPGECQSQNGTSNAEGTQAPEVAQDMPEDWIIMWMASLCHCSIKAPGITHRRASSRKQSSESSRQQQDSPPPALAKPKYSNNSNKTVSLPDRPESPPEGPELIHIYQENENSDLKADSLSRETFQKKIEYFQRIGESYIAQSSPMKTVIPPSKNRSPPKKLQSEDQEKPQSAMPKVNAGLSVSTPKEKNQVTETQEDHPFQKAQNPEPSQEIRNIVKTHKERPVPLPKPAMPLRNVSKPFVKKHDPKEEALAKLGIVGWCPSPVSVNLALHSITDMPPSSPSLPSPPPPPPAKLSNSIKEKQLPLMKLFAQPSPTSPPASMPPPPPVQTPPLPAPFIPTDNAMEDTGVKGSARSIDEDPIVKTQLFSLSANVSFSYANPTWKIFLRKEVFYPKENFSHPYYLNLLCDQILTDTYSESCIRISREERRKMKDLLGKQPISGRRKKLNSSPSPAEQKQLDPPFSSLIAEFKVGMDAKSIAEEGIKKRIVVAARDNWANYFSRLFPVQGESGSDVQILGVSHRGLQLLKRAKEVSFSPEHLKILCSYSYADVLSLELMSRNILHFSLKNEQLIFHSPKASQIKAMVELFLHELKQDSKYVIALRSYVTDDKSLLNFKKGDFIRISYFLAFAKLIVGWQFGSVGGRSGLFPSSMVQLVAPPDYLSLHMNRQEESRKSVRRGTQEKIISKENSATPMASEVNSTSTAVYTADTCHYTMTEFAAAHFREAQPVLGWNEMCAEEKDPALLVQHTKPTLVSGLCVSPYVSFLPDRDRSHRGWQLLSLLTGYFLPSSNLMPYVTKYLQQANSESASPCKEIAQTCQSNLRKMVLNGGRRHLPFRVEMEAFLKGRSSHRILISLPGGQQYSTKIKTFTVAADVMKEISEHMGITEPEEIQEFAILVNRKDGKVAWPLHQKEYIHDFLPEDSLVGLNFCRITWKKPLNFENENYINFHYNQVLQNYMKGKLMLQYNSELEQQVGTLALLQHWARGLGSTPSM
ncbi:hypothetical protein JD844_011588 [Phrynosoma platyrhinos]|uniref:Myosin XVB n=1 Tax=Phrynosoma platyrhinos TaxID=52577 RepID=A0ABQ7TIC4_PHRPL|nr:hypothetical protein JD844_011588 [Phrynosoma platyrhinos]